MKLKDLVDKTGSAETKCDPCANLLYKREPYNVHYPNKLLGPAPGHHMIVMDDVTGRVERMVMKHDGHLGAVDA